MDYLDRLERHGRVPAYWVARRQSQGVGRGARGLRCDAQRDGHRAVERAVAAQDGEGGCAGGREERDVLRGRGEQEYHVLPGGYGVMSWSWRGVEMMG